MKKILATTAVGLSIFAGSIAASGLISPASAQDGSAPSTQQERQRPDRPHARHQIMKGAVKTSAETIGIPAKDLLTQLKAGQSISQVATANGVDPQTVVDALVAKANARIDEAVTNGKLTAEKAAEAKGKVAERVSNAVNHVFDGSKAAK